MKANQIDSPKMLRIRLPNQFAWLLVGCCLVGSREAIRITTTGPYSLSLSALRRRTRPPDSETLISDDSTMLLHAFSSSGTSRGTPNP